MLEGERLFGSTKRTRNLQQHATRLVKGAQFKALQVAAAVRKGEDNVQLVGRKLPRAVVLRFLQRRARGQERGSGRASEAMGEGENSSGRAGWYTPGHSRSQTCRTDMRRRSIMSAHLLLVELVPGGEQRG